MSEAPSAEATMAITMLASVPGVFAFFLPDPLGARDHDERHVRMQQVKGSVASLGLGAVGSAVTRTPWPFLLAVALTGLMLWEYQATTYRCRP